MTVNKFKIVIFLLIPVLILFGCSSEQPNANDGAESNGDGENEEVSSDVSGGELKVVASDNPSTLDPHVSNVSATVDISRHIFETLVTLDSNYEVVPMLAESVEQSEDGKEYTFHLRKGVKFHNGKEMTADDVVASMNRWMETATTSMLLEGSTFSAKDDYTVVLQVEQASPLILPVLAKTQYFAAIMPKEVVESADAEGVKEYIGTGPYKFEDWKDAQYVHLTKYEEYQPVDLPASGLSGKKEALVDDIYFEFVSDTATQFAGIQTGQYDIVLNFSPEYYEQVEEDPNLQSVLSPYGHQVLLFNKNEGTIFSDVKMRQAVNAALDLDAIMLATYAHEDLYSMGPSYAHEDKVMWYSEEGAEFYNQKDTEKAKQLLNEAGYNGEEITIIASREDEQYYNASVVVQEQLKQLGMNVEIEVYDYATLLDRREDPENWDLYIASFVDPSTPVEMTYFKQDYVNGPEDEKTVELLNAIQTAPSLEEASELWNELHGYLWEYLTVVKMGEGMKLAVTTNKVEGFEFFDGPILWNTSKSK